jgi:hypothetical protein
LDLKNGKLRFSHWEEMSYFLEFAYADIAADNQERSIVFSENILLFIATISI